MWLPVLQSAYGAGRLAFSGGSSSIVFWANGQHLLDVLFPALAGPGLNPYRWDTGRSSVACSSLDTFPGNCLVLRSLATRASVCRSFSPLQFAC
jgi:hypothetical protein